MIRVAWMLCALLALSVPGCTWVKSDEEADDVGLASVEDVAACRSVGTTTASVLSRVVFFKRRESSMAKELATLAKNEAAKQGADTVVATSAIESGSQTFDLYDCAAD